MMTFEKVLDIFADYLALDMQMEVCKSRYGYIRVEFSEPEELPGYSAIWSAVLQRNFLTFFSLIMKVTWKSRGQKDAEM